MLRTRTESTRSDILEIKMFLWSARDRRNSMIFIISAISNRARSREPAFDNSEFYRASAQKTRRWNKGLRFLSHQRVRWTATAIRESSPSRVASIRVGESTGHVRRQGKRMAKKIESLREGMKIFGGWIRGSAVINERMLRQPLEYWDSPIEKWSNAEATDYRRLIGPPV